MNKSVLRFSFQGICLLFLVLSLKSGWAGLSFQQGMEALDQKKYAEALSFAERGLKLDPRHPEYLYLAGRAAFENGDNKTAAKYFQAALDEFPFFARAAVYLAVCRIPFGASWQDTQRLLEIAYASEPSSPWVNFMTASQTLKNAPSLSAEEKTESMRRLRSAALAVPARYLVPAYRLIWKATQDFSLLEQMTPRDYLSYKRLIGFIRDENLWKQAQPVFSRYLELRQKFYFEHCANAEVFLQRGSAAKAYAEFLKAWWINPPGREARDGMLKTYAQAGRKLPPGFEDFKEDSAPAGSDFRNAYPASFWSGGAVELSRAKKKTGMFLNLKPGKGKLLIRARSFPDSRGVYGFVIVRLDGVPVGSAYLDHPEEKTLSFPFETQGGRKRLEMELLNAQAKAGKGPVAAPGNVEVKPA